MESKEIDEYKRALYLVLKSKDINLLTRNEIEILFLLSAEECTQKPLRKVRKIK